VSLLPRNNSPGSLPRKLPWFINTLGKLSFVGLYYVKFFKGAREGFLGSTPLLYKCQPLPRKASLG
jgi:hypothetical protein